MLLGPVFAFMDSRNCGWCDSHVGGVLCIWLDSGRICTRLIADRSADRPTAQARKPSAKYKISSRHAARARTNEPYGGVGVDLHHKVSAVLIGVRQHVSERGEAGALELNFIRSSGPVLHHLGYSWPEAYHVTYLPGFDKFVITASQDGPDVFGCSDHAIGFAHGRLDPIEAARQAIVGYWCSQSNGCEQKRWVYLFNEGLIDKKTANDWADHRIPCTQFQA